jgi:hypothetical protein
MLPDVIEPHLELSTYRRGLTFFVINHFMRARGREADFLHLPSVGT